MAVILRKQITLNDEAQEIKVFYPSGVLSKVDRVRAEELDSFLEQEMKEVAARVLKRVEKKANTSKDYPILKWHLFGKELRKITRRKLVIPTDVKSGLIWEAVWQHLPERIRPSRTKTEKTLFSKSRGKGRDHLSVCYALGAYNENDIKWIKRWSDWCRIYYRQGILKDKRVFDALREEIGKLKEYPKLDTFDKITANIAHKFPQQSGKRVHSEVLAKTKIRGYVRSSVAQETRARRH